MPRQNNPPADTSPKAAQACPAVLIETQLRETQRMAALGALAGGIARELNNTVATILGNVELARHDVSDHSRALESLNEISKAGTRARALVQQILSFSRRQPTERTRKRLGPIIEESVHLLRTTLPARLSLEVDCDADVPPALVDAIQIEQIVINLCAHAMQAMRSGCGRIDVRLDTVTLNAAFLEAHPALHALYAGHPGRTLRLAVRDNGPGMDAAALANVFAPFVTARSADENTALSLSEVRDIVQAHEGAIEVDSRLGDGVTFTLFLPAAEAQAGAPDPDESTATSAAPHIGHGQHILYIDDDDSLLFLVERFLKRRGFRVSGYIDHREGLDALRADPDGFDLAVIDYHMPDVSGLDVAREIRSICEDLPVAMASGFIDEALRAQADGAGVRELIFKVSRVEDLCEAFARLARTVQKRSRSPGTACPPAPNRQRNR